MLVAHVEERGFAVVPNVMGKRDIAYILFLIEGTTVPRTRAGIRHLMSDPKIAALASDSRLIALSTQVLGKNAIPYRATLFDKSPVANWKVTWHQDRALPIQEKREAHGWGPWSLKDGVIYAHAPQSALEQVVALRLHLDDSTESNGPLRVIPASHKLGLLSAEQVSAKVENHAPETCLGASGSVLAMRPLLIHASSKSKNDLPRRVLHIEYAMSMDLPDGMRLVTA